MTSQSIDSKVERMMNWLVKKGILFAQERIGQYRKPFTIYKFRTMKYGSDLNPTKTRFDKINWDDERLLRYWVFRYGAFLRWTRIDETPQGYNVYRGEMALVGPRALIKLHWKQEPKEQREERVEVKPGWIPCRFASFEPLTSEAIRRMENTFVQKAKGSSHNRAQLDFAFRMPYAISYRGILALYNFITGKQK